MEDFKFTMEFLDYSDDGGGIFSIDMSEKVAQALIERGVVAILQDYISQKGYPPELTPDQQREKRLDQLLSEDRDGDQTKDS